MHTKPERWTEHHPSCPASNDCEGPWSVGCLCPPFWPRPAAYWRGQMALGAKEVSALMVRVGVTR